MQKHALIWGANGGIARAFIAALLQRDWQVFGIARQSERLKDLGIPAFEADLAREDEIAAAVMWAAQEAGEIHLSLYAAGDVRAVAAADANGADWASTMAANVGGAQATVRHSLPLLASDAHMIFLGAYVERIMLPKLAAYAAGKAALDAYVQTLAKEMRTTRITLARLPAVATPLWDKLPFRLPTRGVLSAEDVARALIDANANGHRGILEL